MYLCAVLLLAAGFPPAFLYQLVAPSVGWVRAGNEGVGTAWVVDAEKRLMVTCRHVVSDGTRVEVFFPQYRGGKLVASKAEYLGETTELRANGGLIRGRVLRKSDEFDLALIQVERLPASAKALSYVRRRPQPGERVLGIGHRYDLETAWNTTTGSVRQAGILSDGYFWSGRRLAVNAEVLILQMPIAEGDSGGPIVDSYGCVIGVISAIRNRTPNAAVGINSVHLNTLLEKAPPSLPLPPRNRFDELAASIVMIRPTATDARIAGVLIDRERRYILTTAHAVRGYDRLGVLFPRIDKSGRILGERDKYRDLIEQVRDNLWHTGRVIARDDRLDLALIQLDSIPKTVNAVSLAKTNPAVGDLVHAIAHPMGLEFAWVYAAGTVRQMGLVQLGTPETKASTLLLQVPSQSNASGGPVVNDRGELLGVLAAKVGTQQPTSYCLTVEEVKDFLANVPLQRWNATYETLRLGTFRRILAQFWFAESERLRAAKLDGTIAEKTALSLDPDCAPALIRRAINRYSTGDVRGAIHDLDVVLITNSRHRNAVELRGRYLIDSGDPKAAVADLGRFLEPEPADAEMRRHLAFALMMAGEDKKALEEFGNVIALDSSQWPAVAADLVTFIEDYIRKHPDSPSSAGEKLAAILNRVMSVMPRGETRVALEKKLASTSDVKNPHERVVAFQQLLKDASSKRR